MTEPTRPRRLEVFAVEDTSAQLTWAALPAGAITVEWEGGRRCAESDGGPGALDLTGLAPASTTAVTVVGRAFRWRGELTTLPSPPGRELFRFATISDLHLGRSHFGIARTIREPDATELHPSRCTRAAIDDLTAWGAAHLVVKGDIVDSRHGEAWTEAARVLGDLPVTSQLMCGNHDRAAHGVADPFVEAERVGLQLVDGVEFLDVPGARIVVMDSAVDDVDIGRWDHLEDECAARVSDADGAAVVMVHHQPQRLTLPTHLPRGIPAPSANRFIKTLAAANGDVIGSSGHTHRNRRRVIHGLPWTEVGSTKDYPGVWAGYVVHEGGIRQVVRRVARPDCIAWTERTRRCAFGLWGMWSPGRLDDRCFTWEWSGR